MMLRMYRGPLRAGLAVLLAPLLMPAAAEAQDDAQQAASRSVPAEYVGDKAPYQLVLDHVTGDIEVLNHKGELQEQWLAREQARSGVAALISLPPDRPLVVVIENANSLRYTYGVTVTDGRASGVRACRDMGRSFTQTGLMTSLGAIQGISAMGGLDASFDADTPTGQGLISLFSSFSDGARGSANAALLEEEFNAAAPAVERFIEDAGALMDRWSALDDSLRVIARVADSQPIDELLARIQASARRTLTGLDEQSAVATVLQKHFASFAPNIAMVGGAAEQAKAANYTGAWVDRANRLVAQSDSVQSALVAASLQLEEKLFRIERARRDATQVFTFPMSNNYRKVSVMLTKAEGYQDLPMLRENVDVFTEPSVSLVCSISIGFAFMDQPIEYQTEAGVLALKDREDNLRTAPSLLFHFSLPSAPLLTGLLGIGIGTQRAPDLYVGGSLAYFRPLMINAGWVFQRTSQLPDGLGIGDAVSGSSTLDNFPRRYRSAFFLGFSVGR